jgi:hypothetical protein
MNDLTKDMALKKFKDLTEAEMFWFLAEMDGATYEHVVSKERGVEQYHFNHGDEFIQTHSLAWNDSSVICKYFQRHVTTQKIDYLTSHDALRSVELRLKRVNNTLINNKFPFVYYRDVCLGGGAKFTVNYIDFDPEQKFLALAETIHQMRRDELEKGETKDESV